MIPWLHNFTAKRCIAGLFLLNSTMAAPIDGVLLEVIAPSLWVCACSAGGQEFLTHHVHHRRQGTPVPGDLLARDAAGHPCHLPHRCGRRPGVMADMCVSASGYGGSQMASWRTTNGRPCTARTIRNRIPLPLRQEVLELRS